jgi:hypothetical protein
VNEELTGSASCFDIWRGTFLKANNDYFHYLGQKLVKHHDSPFHKNNLAFVDGHRKANFDCETD